MRLYNETPEQETAAMAESDRRRAAALLPQPATACPPHVWFRQTGQEGHTDAVVLLCHGSCGQTRVVNLVDWTAAQSAGTLEALLAGTKG